MPAAMRVLCAGVLFATGGALIKACGFPSLQRAGLRAAFAALTILALLPEARRWPDRRVLRLLPAYFGATCLFVVANALTTAASAIFLQATAPLWVLVLGPLLLRERTSRRNLVTMVGVAAGMVLCLTAPAAIQVTAPEPRLGDAIALLSGISYAFLLLGMRWLSQLDHGACCAAVAWGNLFTCPVAFALMPAVGQTPILGSSADWVVIVVLGVLQVGLAYVLLVRAMAEVPAVRASLLLMIEPALNPLIALAVHGEAPHVLTFVGGAVIVGAVAAGSVLRRPRFEPRS